MGRVADVAPDLLDGETCDERPVVDVVVGHSLDGTGNKDVLLPPCC